MKKLFLILCVAIFSGCSPQPDNHNIYDKKPTEDKITKCTGMGEVRTVEEAIKKGYRLRTKCSLPEVG